MNSLASQVYTLKQVLSEQLDWHEGQVSILADLIQVNTVDLAELDTVFNGRFETDSNYRCLRSFLRGFELSLLQLARQAAKLAGFDDKSWHLTLDRTKRCLDRYKNQYPDIGHCL